MEVIENAADMRRWSRAHRVAGRRVAFVPTMGYLHDGHLSLVREAKNRADVVVDQDELDMRRADGGAAAGAAGGDQEEEEEEVPYRLAWQSGSGGVWTLGGDARRKGRAREPGFQSSSGLLLPHGVGVEIVEVEEGGMDVYVRWSTGDDLLTYIRRSYDREGMFTGAAMVSASAVAEGEESV